MDHSSTVVGSVRSSRDLAAMVWKLDKETTIMTTQREATLADILLGPPVGPEKEPDGTATTENPDPGEETVLEDEDEDLDALDDEDGGEDFDDDL